MPPFASVTNTSIDLVDPRAKPFAERASHLAGGAVRQAAGGARVRLPGQRSRRCGGVRCHARGTRLRAAAGGPSARAACALEAVAPGACPLSCWNPSTSFSLSLSLSALSRSGRFRDLNPPPPGRDHGRRCTSTDARRHSPSATNFSGGEAEDDAGNCLDRWVGSVVLIGAIIYSNVNIATIIPYFN